MPSRHKAHVFNRLLIGTVPERGLEEIAVGVEQHRGQSHGRLPRRRRRRTSPIPPHFTNIVDIVAADPDQDPFQAAWVRTEGPVRRGKGRDRRTAIGYGP
jgi:hypothetical protein